MTQTEQVLKPLNFFLVLCKTRKKFDKYIKINKIRNKYIIDIKKMMEEEDIDPNEVGSSDLFKILVLKKFNMAKEKKKDIYYIPNFNITKQYSKLFNIKTLLEDTHNFNLLYYYEDFEKWQQPENILDKIQEFDHTQILKDY
jgi:hypothetical protein